MTDWRKFHRRGARELEDICAMTAFGRPRGREEGNMLINYLNVVGGQLADVFGRSCDGCGAAATRGD